MPALQSAIRAVPDFAIRNCVAPNGASCALLRCVQLRDCIAHAARCVRDWMGSALRSRLREALRAHDTSKFGRIPVR